jgi:hypothetical protein
LYYHVVVSGDFEVFQPHGFSHSKKSSVDARHKEVPCPTTIFEPVLQVQEVQSRTSNSGSANQRFESSLPSHSSLWFCGCEIAHLLDWPGGPGVR